MVEDPRVIALARIRNYIAAIRENAADLLTGRADNVIVINAQAMRLYWSWIAIRNILWTMMSEFAFELTDEEIFEELLGEHVARW